MAKIMMSMEILNVICAVRAYRKFAWADHRAHNQQMQNYDGDKLCQEYYESLPLPPELKRNHYDFEAVMAYGEDRELYNRLINTEECDLGNLVWKNC